MALHRLEPVGECVWSHERLDLATRLRRQLGPGLQHALADRRVGAALAHDLGGDPLGDLAHHAAVAAQEGAA